LRVGGVAYTVTDVEELHVWMVKHFSEHPLFARIQENELQTDPVIPFVMAGTEEGKKVDRAKGNKFLAVFKRIQPQ